MKFCDVTIIIHREGLPNLGLAINTEVDDDGRVSDEQEEQFLWMIRSLTESLNRSVTEHLIRAKKQ